METDFNAEEDLVETYEVGGVDFTFGTYHDHRFEENILTQLDLEHM